MSFNFRFFDRSRENVARAARDYGRDSLGVRDGSEMVVSDVCVKGKAKSYFLTLISIKKCIKNISGEKKRHHHHHHKNNHRNGDFRDPNLMGNGRRHY